MKESNSILIIRLGAMGDIIHALPAVASLKCTFPERKLTWVVARRWMPLLQGNPHIDELVPFDRSGIAALFASHHRLGRIRPTVAIDLQGLLQSALAGRFARPETFFGFDRSVAREPLAARLYTHRIHVTGPHRIQRNMQLVEAVGASQVVWDTWLPEGMPEGDLPSTDFVLASPFAGWKSKEWPIARWDTLGKLLEHEGLPLILNMPVEQARGLAPLKHCRIHSSSLEGLIYATRRATAVIGLDSGPLHLAAALGKPGVALFGPTDPLQTGPFRSSMVVLRAAEVQTTYKRDDAIHQSMNEITVEQVALALQQSLAAVVVRQS